MRTALAAGVEREEILDVFALTSIIGMHTATAAVPVLVAALEERGDDVLAAPLDGRAKELWDRDIDGKRYWDEFLDIAEFGVFLRGLAALDAPLFETYIELSLEPWRNGVLEPKVREFVYIAIDSVTTHLYRPGLDIHIRTALAFGATKQEIMAVLEIAAQAGLRTIAVGVAVLFEELLAAEET